MTDRFPLIIDTEDKKLKELPIGDNLRVDGDIVIQGSVVGNVNGSITITDSINSSIPYSVLTNTPFIPTDISELTDTNRLLTETDISASVFGNDSTLLVDAVNSSIPYNVLSGAPFIPTDVSELTDNLGIIGGGGGGAASTFLALTDTPSGYEFNANKFLRVSEDETGVDYDDLNTNDIENALSYTPYNGIENSQGFLTIDSAIPYNNLINPPFIPTDVGELSDNQNLIPTDVGELTDNQNLIPTDVGELTDNQNLIPTDVSELTDNQGILGASTFLALTDTPATYGFSTNKFLRVAVDETGIQYGDLNTTDIENALGYTPYNGTENPSNFLIVESDTLNSVVQRGNNTSLSVSLNSVLATSLVSNTAMLTEQLEFFDNNLTAKFNINVENNKILSLANRLDIDTAVDSVTISNCSFLGFQSSIGSAASYWNSVYTNNLFVESINNKPNTPITVGTDQDVNFFLSQTNKVKLTGTGCLQLSKLTTAQRNALTAEVGDIIYNIDLSTVQIYVAITGWTEGDNPLPIPGWISLYTPPAPPTGE